MNRSWFIYYGYQMGLTRKETICTRYGEFMDLMACDAITKGQAKYKKPARRMTTEEMLKVR